MLDIHPETALALDRWRALRDLDPATVVAAIEDLGPCLARAGLPPRDRWVDLFARQVHFSNLEQRALHDR